MFHLAIICRALATGVRASIFISHINKHCSICGLLETDAHLFFHCVFARAVWFSAAPPLHAETLPMEDDGVQDILPIIINTSTDQSLFQQILTTLWYLW